MNATNPDLTRFAAHGGRLLGAPTPGVVRLFMQPGVSHCGGGPGRAAFDLQAALETWVGGNAAPDRIVAPDGPRPLCPHPQVARYKGSGATADPANFTCAPTRPPPSRWAWRRSPSPRA